MDETIYPNFSQVLASLERRYQALSTLILEPKRARLDVYLAPFVVREEVLQQEQSYLMALLDNVQYFMKASVLPGPAEWQSWLQLNIDERMSEMVEAHAAQLAKADGYIEQGQWVDYTDSRRKQAVTQYRTQLMQTFPVLFRVAECQCPVDIEAASQLRIQLAQRQQALEDELEAIMRDKNALQMSYFESEHTVSTKIQSYIASLRKEAGVVDMAPKHERLLAILDSGDVRQLAQYLVPIAEKVLGSWFTRASRLEKRGWCDYLLRRLLPNNCLSEACRAGNVARVEYLLAHGFRVDKHDGSDHSRAHLPIQHAQEKAGYYPLHRAMEADPDVVKALLELLAKQPRFDVDVLGPYGRTALHSAALFGNVVGARWLLAHGANPNAIEVGRFQGNSVLHNAVSYGHIEVLQLLLEQPTLHLLALNKTGITPLCEAVLSPHMDSATFHKVSQCLMRQGCCLSVADWTVLEGREDMLLRGTTEHTQQILNFLHRQSVLLPQVLPFLARLMTSFDTSAPDSGMDGTGQGQTNEVLTKETTSDGLDNNVSSSGNSPKENTPSFEDKVDIIDTGMVESTATQTRLQASMLHTQQGLDNASLASIRQIEKINLAGSVQPCRIVPAAPDGDCGLTAIRRCLTLGLHQDLAHHFTREGCIALVSRHSADKAFSVLIEAIFSQDKCRDLASWTTAFAKPGSLWLAEHHLRLLSKALDVVFHVYYVNDAGQLAPVPCYETLSETLAPSSVSIHLAHVNTRLFDTQVTFNHFEGICVRPTPAQQQQIEAWLAEMSLPHPESFGSPHRNMMTSFSPFFAPSAATTLFNCGESLQRTLWSEEELGLLHRTMDDRQTWSESIALLGQLAQGDSLSTQQRHGLTCYFTLCQTDFTSLLDEQRLPGKLYQKAQTFVEQALRLLENASRHTLTSFPEFDGASGEVLDTVDAPSSSVPQKLLG